MAAPFLATNTYKAPLATREPTVFCHDHAIIDHHKVTSDTYFDCYSIVAQHLALCGWKASCLGDSVSFRFHTDQADIRTTAAAWIDRKHASLHGTKTSCPKDGNPILILICVFSYDSCRTKVSVVAVSVFVVVLADSDRGPYW
jgi:hypothetical protein